MDGTEKKVSRWYEQLEKLRAILNEGHAIAGEIVGSEPESDKAEAAKPSCHIDRLSNELAQVLRSADYLVSQLRKINAAF